MKRLEIQTEFARIGIKTQMARMTIHNNYRQAKVELAPVSPQEVPAEETVKGQAGKAPAAYPGGQQQAQSAAEPAGNVAGVMELSRQFGGTQLAAVDSSALPAQQAQGEGVSGFVVRRAQQSIDVQVTEAAVPSIESNGGVTRINWEPYELQIEWDDVYMPEFNVEPHSVEIFMENHPSITISVVEDGGLLIQRGRNVDRKV